MGGDTVKDEVESSSNPDFSRSSSPCSCCFSDDLGFKDGVSEENIPKFSSHPSDLRKREKGYQENLQSHDLLQETLKSSKRKLKLARHQILSYTPGSWADVNLSGNDIPKTTSILIVGPKGAGKSSLVNKITRVFEENEFAPARAQESYGKPSKGGTLFVQQYMIPRGCSAFFCLYDTRGLSQISSLDNTSMIEQWITRGVHHGEPVIWTSDSLDLRDRLIRDSGTGCEIRKVNSVIFVVNAVEILKSMESGTSYAHMISTAFNCPLLSFKDDKPAVAMTHGDILSWEERARVRVFLGELLGIPPDKQIFDIPESQDTATALTICNLLRHSLENADKNLVFLPKRNFTISKVEEGVTKRTSLLNLMIVSFLTLFLALAIICIGRNPTSSENVAQLKLHLDRSPRLYNLTVEAQSERWRVTGCLNHDLVPNLESESVPEGEPSIDWHTARRLWLDEEKVDVAEAEAEAEPSSDWRMTHRRLWYVE